MRLPISERGGRMWWSVARAEIGAQRVWSVDGLTVLEYAIQLTQSGWER
jgi:hypothetical protein